MKENRLTEGNILGSLLRFAIPVLAALFLQAMYGAVDLLVVGKYAQIADQSGVATGSMFTTSLGNVITCFALLDILMDVRRQCLLWYKAL